MSPPSIPPPPSLFPPIHTMSLTSIAPSNLAPVVSPSTFQFTQTTVIAIICGCVVALFLFIFIARACTPARIRETTRLIIALYDVLNNKRTSNLKDVAPYMSPQVAAINSTQPVRLQATKAPDQTQSKQTPQASIVAQPLAPKESQSPLLVVVLPTGPAQNVQGALSNSNTQLSKELVVVEKLVSGRVATSNINFKTLASQRTPLSSQQSQQHRITTTATKMSHQNATQKSTKS